jgi:hypothetical protein
MGVKIRSKIKESISKGLRSIFLTLDKSYLLPIDRSVFSWICHRKQIILDIAGIFSTVPALCSLDL